MSRYQSENEVLQEVTEDTSNCELSARKRFNSDKSLKNTIRP